VTSGGRDAHAGAIVAKKGSTTVVNDPQYDYDFEIDLVAGSTLSTGGFITVYDIPFLLKPVLTAQPNEWTATSQDTGKTPSGTPMTPPFFDNPNVPNVTWTYLGPPISTSSDMDLGTFIVGVTSNLDFNPSPTLLFVGSLNGLTFSNLGTVVVNAPEPSSVALLLTGVVALPLFWRCSKGQAQRRKVATPV
jgi:hypothetical protein